MKKRPRSSFVESQDPASSYGTEFRSDFRSGGLKTGSKRPESNDAHSRALVGKKKKKKKKPRVADIIMDDPVDDKGNGMEGASDAKPKFRNIFQKQKRDPSGSARK